MERYVRKKQIESNLKEIFEHTQYSKKNDHEIYIYSKIPFELFCIANTVKEASKITGADESNIRKILKGAGSNKSSKGFYFSFGEMKHKPIKRSTKMG